jgi:transposase InsO family protein
VTRFPVTDLFFRPFFAFFIVELKSRKVIHVGVTRSPTDAWTAQQLREATAYGVGPKYLIRDNDSKFGVVFARVAKTSGIKILKTPYHAPRANAICERFLGSVWCECLDHLLILQEKQLDRVLHAYVQYFNRARPHQGIRQQIPDLRRISHILLSYKREGERSSGPGWVAPRLSLGSLK